MADSTVKIKKTVFDIFVEGAKKGWTIGVNSIIPNVLMAFVITRFLEVTGLLALIGNIFRPFMMLLGGMPGEAATVLIAAFLSMGGGVGVAVALYNGGTLTLGHIAMLLPAIYLMGSQIQYIGRILGCAEVKPRYYGVIIGLAVVNALLAIVVMRIIVAIAM